MKRLKFRVWDTKENCWYRPTHKAYEGKLHEIVIGLSGSLNVRAMDCNGREYLEHESLFPNRYIINQWAGILDKNGKEAFESDIIKHGNDFGIIEYEDDRFIIKWVTETFYNEIARYHVPDSEVVGNYFEHMHLLEQPKAIDSDE